MQPLQELLDRIKWDAEFGRGAFALAYYDRIARREVVVPLASVTLARHEGGLLSVRDEHGLVVQIPMHRVRTVYKDGVAIWQRPGRPD